MRPAPRTPDDRGLATTYCYRGKKKEAIKGKEKGAISAL